MISLSTALSNKKSTKVLSVLVIIASVLVGIGIFMPQKAEARINLDPYPNDFWIPSGIRSSLEVCDEVRPIKSPGFVSWIALKDFPSVTAFTVPKGTPSIELRYVFAAAVCHPWSPTTATSNIIVGTSAGAESMNGRGFGINFGSRNKTVGAYEVTSQVFTFAPPGGFNKSGWYQVRFDIKAINLFTNGVSQCVGGAEPIVSNFLDFGPCNISSPVFNFYVTVPENPVIENIEGRAQGTCDNISGWAFDPDVPLRSTPVHVYVDYPAGDPRAQSFQVIADRPRADVNQVYPSTGNTPHGFNIDISRFHANGESRRYYIYFISYDADGVDQGNRKLEIVDVPSCGTPFNLTPKGTVTLDDDEEPTNVTFGNVGINPNSRTVSGITVSPRYEIRKHSGGSPITLTPNPGPFTGVTVGPSGATLITGDVRGLSGLVAGDKVCLVVTLSPGQGSLNTSGGFIAGTTRDKTVDVGCEVVSDKPYTAFMGNDVYAGSNFASLGCGAASGAEIKAFSKVSGGQILGSGAQLAAGAVAAIDGFASGVTSSSNQKQLTFANTGAGSGTYGGYFGQTRCVPDYYAQAPGSPGVAGAVSPPSGNGKFTQHVRPSGSYVQLNGASNIQGKVAIYVDGDVVINNNVQYATTGWSSPDTVPSFYLVVRGNIYITSGVSQLDGVYVAQPKPDGSKGTIYTCAKSNATTYAATELIGNCSSQLTVYGSFISKQTKLLRTKGSMRDGRSSYAGNAAEVFRFSPEAYAGTPAIPPVVGGTNDKTQSYSTLPPVL